MRRTTGTVQGKPLALWALQLTAARISVNAVDIQLRDQMPRDASPTKKPARLLTAAVAAAVTRIQFGASSVWYMNPPCGALTSHILPHVRGRIERAIPRLCIRVA